MKGRGPAVPPGSVRGRRAAGSGAAETAEPDLLDERARGLLHLVVGIANGRERAATATGAAVAGRRAGRLTAAAADARDPPGTEAGLAHQAVAGDVGAAAAAAAAAAHTDAARRREVRRRERVDALPVAAVDRELTVDHEVARYQPDHRVRAGAPHRHARVDRDVAELEHAALDRERRAVLRHHQRRVRVEHDLWLKRLVVTDLRGSAATRRGERTTASAALVHRGPVIRIMGTPEVSRGERVSSRGGRWGAGLACGPPPSSHGRGSGHPVGPDLRTPLQGWMTIFSPFDADSPSGGQGAGEVDSSHRNCRYDVAPTSA